jgi:hypothetical protein
LCGLKKKPLGTIISDLARCAFLNSAASGAMGERSAEVAPPQASERLARYGIHPLPSRGGIVSNDLIDRLREAEGI